MKTAKKKETTLRLLVKNVNRRDIMKIINERLEIEPRTLKENYENQYRRRI